MARTISRKPVSLIILLQTGPKLEPEELSHVERIYEKVWQGLGEDSCKSHIDKKRKGLRF